MRLIDADALQKAMFSYYPCINEHSCKWNYSGDTLMDYEVADLIEDCIGNAPTIEAEPVKHGRWKGAGMGDYSCSLCMEVVSGNENNYCPNCGAKMRC